METTSPFFVSVIVPVYNGENFLAQAIENLQQQNYQPLEIIVVDDGSTDGTAEIATQFKDQIRYVYQPNRGPSAARNRGIKMAAGDVIAFLDVDDLWPANKLALQLSSLAANPSVDIVQGLIQEMQPLFTSTTDDAPIFEETSRPYQFVNIGSAIYRKSVFDKVGLFDETLNYAEDVDLFHRAREQNIAKMVLDEVTLFYRKHKHNMTRGKNLVELGVLKAHKKCLDRRRQQGSSSIQALSEVPSVLEYLGQGPVNNNLENKHFTIISNDSWAGKVYDDLGIIYKTPFIDTHLLAPCYITLLKNLKRYLTLPLTFTAVSRYDFFNKEREKRFYPIGLLNGDVEIHFPYDQDEITAKKLWDERVKRIHWDNLFVKFSGDNLLCTKELIKEFDNLNFSHKVCFTAKEYPMFKSTVCIKDGVVEGETIYPVSKKSFDVVRWLNKKLTRNDDF